ncbi:competence protein CoiA family protein [Microbacterium sp. MC2]
MRHATQNAAFTGQPEVRQVFARTSSGAIEYMPDGNAQAFKDRRAAGETFSCLVPGCDCPVLTVVDRKSRRDGFAHHSGGGHPGMGLAHLQAQLLVQRWVRTRYPSLQVELEMTTEDRSRRADVMVISPASGARIAFEIQYAGMTPEEWETRHLSYQQQGIVDIWLWGYGGEHARPTTSGSNRINGSTTLRAVTAHGSTILFIDPEWEHIGYVSHLPEPFAAPDVRALCPDGYGQFHTEPMDAFRLNADRQLTSTNLEELVRGAELIRIAREKQEREWARARATEQAQKAQKEQAKTRFLERVGAKAADSERRWTGSSDHREILALFGIVPQVLQHEPVSGNTPIRLPVAPMVWQGRLYLRHIHKQPVGRRLSIRRMSSELEHMDPDIRFAEEAVRSWLGALETRGVVARVPTTHRYDRWPKFTVAAALTTGEVTSNGL